ncbi:dnaJ homolog subfamily C member 25-like [Dysidea avara]|uniref:dnaJ homolog subfamily C member 25-like n=1 Tax=Dysidea avara TaxID=196820 RepID=UPI00333154E9
MALWRIVTIVGLLQLYGVAGLVPNLYCGEKNCYDVLGVTRDSEKSEISKAYRKLAIKYHPDRYKADDAEEKFREIATAYETLKDDGERADYDYMLDHPEEYYYHYYQFYRRRMAPQVDVRVVIATVIGIVSIIQYISWYQSYHSAISYALQQARYRTKAKAIAKETGQLPDEKKLRKSGMTRDDIKQEEEQVLRSVIEQNINIMGGYRKPHLWDVLAVQMLLWPYYGVCYLRWYIHWVWKFDIQKCSYGNEEKAYLTRKRVGITFNQWELIGEAKRNELINRELWIPDNLAAYKKEQEEEMKEKMAESTKHKQYRRYMKTHGPSRMTFHEE